MSGDPRKREDDFRELVWPLCNFKDALFALKAMPGSEMADILISTALMEKPLPSFTAFLRYARKHGGRKLEREILALVEMLEQE